MEKRKKTRVAIFTITRDTNYGNRLQNYALQEVLKSFSDETHEVEAETVTNELWHWMPFDYSKPLEECVTEQTYQSLLRQMPLSEISRYIGKNVLRHQAFVRFDQENINQSDVRITRRDVPGAGKALRASYDWGVVGSDQIWNVYIQGVSSFDFAACMPPERRVAYAGSFGMKNVPEQVKTQYQNLLRGLAQISVREDAGAAIVAELTGRKAEVVPDPTMLLPTEIWQLVMEKPKSLQLPPAYLLSYHLQHINRSYIERERALAKEKGLAFLEIPGEDVPFYNLGPAEFVYLIAHATAVVTDSFHGSCFSILFGKPVLCIARSSENPADMSSRFDTLLSTYGLEQRRVAQAEEITAERLFANDMGDVPRRIRERRKIGTAFLESALPGVGGKLRLNSVALVRRDRCTGCSACAAACPQAAITMKHESKGGRIHISVRGSGGVPRLRPLPRHLSGLPPDGSAGGRRPRGGRRRFCRRGRSCSGERRCRPQEKFVGRDVPPAGAAGACGGRRRHRRGARRP
ncbi:polysaccharide pyruvyl transferase family protein [uncultured Selenomonas sp.]|uniref:polysaccharide pyruvyl transferase family protein n=1 Tax=uncultured Selenomonas sp. TaxID=159275 RepID=UPI0025FFF314|nr:polysaccharide pyruvyl transferase family protein [uncultured Selenomonas sp.]